MRCLIFLFLALGKLSLLKYKKKFHLEKQNKFLFIPKSYTQRVVNTTLPAQRLALISKIFPLITQPAVLWPNPKVKTDRDNDACTPCARLTFNALAKSALRIPSSTAAGQRPTSFAKIKMPVQQSRKSIQIEN